VRPDRAARCGVGLRSKLSECLLIFRRSKNSTVWWHSTVDRTNTDASQVAGMSAVDTYVVSSFSRRQDRIQRAEFRRSRNQTAATFFEELNVPTRSSRVHLSDLLLLTFLQFDLKQKGKRRESSPPPPHCKEKTRRQLQRATNGVVVLASVSHYLRPGPGNNRSS
jgi:hypothetical protein